ncbi:MAG: hypothetical protein V9F00_13190 [Nocardioides sp.]
MSTELMITRHVDVATPASTIGLSYPATGAASGMQPARKACVAPINGVWEKSALDPTVGNFRTTTVGLPAWSPPDR